MMDNLGDRMKANYENRSKTYLTRRTPVIIRIDGKAFHTFTKGFIKPFDTVFTESMQKTMLFLCKNIQGCVLGYTQSDEITLILLDYMKLNTSAWFDYNVQKICSVSAALATLEFNRVFKKEVDSLPYDSGIYNIALEKGAVFDARCFNIPKEEVANCILWRQQDAIRNSIMSLGLSFFGHKELQNLNTKEIIAKLKEENVHWEDLPLVWQRGCCCVKKEVDKIDSWVIDYEIPIFKGEGLDYIENLL